MTARENRTGPYEMPNEPGIPDMLRVDDRQAALLLNTHNVARVTSYNPVTQTASLSVEILQVVKDHFTQPTPQNPNPVNVQTPVQLVDIKVAWPRTSAGYLTFPLGPGDTGELHVQDRSIDLWRAAGAPTDPVSGFIHMLGDSVFHPNIRPDADAITPPTSLAATVLEGPLIFFGALADQPLLLGTGFGGPMVTYVTALNAASVVWNASLKDPAATVVFLNAQATATIAFFATISAWLSAKVFTE